MRFINLTTIESGTTLTVPVNVFNLLYFRAAVNAPDGLNSLLMFVGNGVLNVVETEAEILALLGVPVAGIDAASGIGTSVATPSI